MNTENLTAKAQAFLLKRPGRDSAMASSVAHLRGMRTLVAVFALTFGALLAVVPTTDAAVPDPAAQAQPIGTLTIPGITEQAVPVFSAGISTNSVPAPIGGGGIGQVRFGFFNLTKQIDTASPRLFIGLISQQIIPEVRVDIFVPDGTQTLLTSYELSSVLVVGLVSRTVRVGENRVFIEEVALDYGKIKYTVFAPSGPVVGCWDRASNSLC